MSYKAGQKIETWFSHRSDGMSMIVAVRLYTGKYPQWFTQVLTVTAPRTKAGTLEMVV